MTRSRQGALAFVLWLVACPASSQERLAFEWSTPDGGHCSSRAAVLDLVAEALGEPPLLAETGRSVRVRVERTPAGWLADIRVAGIDSPRLIAAEGSDCSLLDAPVALVVTLLLTPPEEVVTAPSPPVPWSAVLDLGGVATFGLLGDAALGVSFGADLDLGAPFVALRVVFTGWPGQIAGAPIGVELSGWRAAVAACGRPVLDRWLWLEGCGVVAGGVLDGIGRGVTRPQASSNALFEVSLTLGAVLWLLPPLGVRLSVGGGMTLPRMRWFVVDGGERRVVEESEWVTGSVSLSLVVRIGA